MQSLFQLALVLLLAAIAPEVLSQDFLVPTESLAPSPDPSNTITIAGEIPTDSPEPTPTPSLPPSKLVEDPTASPVAPAAPNPIECGDFTSGESCQICGPGMCATKLDEIIFMPGSLTCGKFEDGGNGITKKLCNSLLAVAGEACGCEPATTNPAAAPAPLPATPEPLADCLDYTDVHCRICGAGKCVTLPDVVFNFPGQPQVPCGQFEEAARGGSVGPFGCPFLPDWVSDQCGCEAPFGAPTPPTPVPTREVIDFPLDSSQGGKIEDQTMSGGAIFGIIFAVIVASVAGTFFAYKVLQERSIRKTHDRRLTLDPASPAGPPQSLFMSSPGAINSVERNLAAGEFTDDPEDGVMEEVPVGII